MAGIARKELSAAELRAASRTKDARAAVRSAGPHRDGVRRHPARTDGRQAIGGIGIQALVSTPAPPEVGPASPDGVQKTSPGR